MLESVLEASVHRRQLAAVVKKTWKLKYRDGRTLLTEVCAPLTLIFLLLYGFSLSEVTDTPARHYTTAPVPLSALGDAVASSINITTPLGPINLASPALSQITPPLTLTDLITLGNLVRFNATNWTAFERQLVTLVNATCSQGGIDCSVNNVTSSTANRPNCYGGICVSLNPSSTLAVGDIFQMLRGPLPVPPFDLYVAISRLAQASVGDRVNEGQLQVTVTVLLLTN